MPRASTRFLIPALTFASVFLLGWLAWLELSGAGWRRDAVELSSAVLIIPALTLSTIVGALAALLLLDRRADTYPRGQFLGRVALGAVLTLLLCPFAILAALRVASGQVFGGTVLWTAVLAAAGLVVGAAGLTLGLELPLGTVR